jgi:8-oxo-dGTP pyrophosphatase MutT (NUDIX family)
MPLNQRQELLVRLAEKLQEPLPAKEALAMMFPHIKAMPKEIPNDAKPSAVMILLFEKNEEWHILAMRRTEDGHAHSGQISFPGGKHESDDESMLHTALRETYEEMGIDSSDINILGALSPVYIVVSNFNVFPYVGYIQSTDAIRINPNEVHAVLEIPLKELFHQSAKIKTEVVSPAFPNSKRSVNAYQVQEGTIIWGATAIMIAELELLLQRK